MYILLPAGHQQTTWFPNEPAPGSALLNGLPIPKGHLFFSDTRPLRHNVCQESARKELLPVHPAGKVHIRERNTRHCQQSVRSTGLLHWHLRPFLAPVTNRVTARSHPESFPAIFPVIQHLADQVQNSILQPAKADLHLAGKKPVSSRILPDKQSNESS